jgi:hypothetical protein
MGTEIKTWEIVDGKLSSIDTTLKTEGRTEPYDLEPWLSTNPEIIGPDIMIIGRQVKTKSGPIDLLGIDKSGNTVIIEIKRDELPRESLAQAIDYASDVADWTVERLGEVCSEYRGKSFEDAFNDAFPEVDAENVNLNNTQRIVLVGFSIEASLERMVEWLSDSYGVNINAIVLSYVKTKSGNELLTKTSIISEEMEQERFQKPKKFKLAERHLRRLEFWKQLLDRAKCKTNLHANVSPVKDNWVTAGAGRSGMGWSYAITMDKGSVELFIDRGPDRKDETDRIFEKILKDREKIEKEFGETLIWDRVEGRRVCRIKSLCEIGGLKDTALWDGIQEDMIDRMVRLEKVLRPILSTVK